MFPCCQRQVRLSVNALGLFQSELSSETVCDPADVAHNGQVAFVAMEHPLKQPQVRYLLLLPQLNRYPQPLLEFKLNALIYHWGLLPIWLGKLADRFCPCCEGVHAMWATSRTSTEYILEDEIWEDPSLTARGQCWNRWWFSVLGERCAVCQVKMYNPQRNQNQLYFLM